MSFARKVRKEGYIELDLFSGLSAIELEFIFGDMTACKTRLVCAIEGLAY